MCTARCDPSHQPTENRDSNSHEFNVFANVSKQSLAEIRNGQILFEPPVYRQRYAAVYDVLQHDQWADSIHKIIDFGCSEFGIFVYIKQLTHLRELLCIDVDDTVLTNNVYRLFPLTLEHVRPRSEPLVVKTLLGSVEHPDERLLDTDAVTAIELIEHLYPDVLDAFPYNIFGYIRPKLVLITTPNSDFNVLFLNFSGFRHNDHKFEWTREQFTAWCLNITARFPDYTVNLSGVGLGPADTAHLGWCSQMAVFIRKDTICKNYTIRNRKKCNCEGNSRCKNYSSMNEFDGELLCRCVCLICHPKLSHGVCQYQTCTGDVYLPMQSPRREKCYFTLLKTINYPYHTDLRTEEGKLLDEIKYRINQHDSPNSNYYNMDKRRSEIPLSKLTYGIKGDLITVKKLRKLLVKSDFKVEECSVEDSEKPEGCVICEFDMESTDTDGNSSASGYESDHVDCPIKEMSWDEPDEVHDNVKNTTVDDEKLNLDIAVDPKQKALLDSGYQKSPQTPPEAATVPYYPYVPTRYINTTKKMNWKSNNKDSDSNDEDGSAKNWEAGPSNRRKKPIKPSSRNNCEAVNEVKSIANCILKNTLNKIDVDEEMVDEPRVERVAVAAVVENGDLANNNRDLEGNNYPAEEEGGQPLVEIGNGNEIENNNDADPIIVNNERQEVVQDEVDWPSGEALFDPNSQQDLLEDFDMVAGNNREADDSRNLSNQIAIINLNPEVVNDNNGFPLWLLQMLNEEHLVADAVIDEAANPDDGDDYHCQGDGLGVHPSVLSTTSDDGMIDADDETESSSSSSSGVTESSLSTASDVDVNSLPTAVENVVVPTASSDEFFDVENVDDARSPDLS